MALDLDKRRVRKQRQTVPRKTESTPSAPSVGDTRETVRDSDLNYEKNPSWRLTAAGQAAPTTPPWLLVTLAFGLPFALLVLLSFVL